MILLFGLFQKNERFLTLLLCFTYDYIFPQNDFFVFRISLFTDRRAIRASDDWTIFRRNRLFFLRLFLCEFFFASISNGIAEFLPLDLGC